MEGVKYRLSDFDYELPEELIAQYPLKQRDACRLMVIDRTSGNIYHKKFPDIKNYLQPGDCLVLNDTRVFPARLYGIKDKTRARVEIFLLRSLEGNVWEILVKPARKVRIGNKIIFNNSLSCDIIDNTLSGGRIAQFHYQGDFMEILSKVGKTPLPPYIKREPGEDDAEYYQTVYARNHGAVAAPTAGLHFTKEILQDIEKKGVKLAYVTLHVSLGTFKPVQVEDISRHRMDSEYYEVSPEAAKIINETREKKRKIIAVGTTSVRILETVANHSGLVRPVKGWTDKFIYPPAEFRAVDHLLTNFHLPKSTLLMLVAAFSSLDKIMEAYQEAIKQKYRFFSYGDAMFII
ncbi:MAG: tRNA preQ1(34) S-adenosylmethionine ribosyltransferase-isomerase QueA [Calditrichia bacterium]